MKQHLSLSVEHKHALQKLQVVIFDVDNTLVFAKNPEFYSQYGVLAEKAIEIYYSVHSDQSKEIANFYRAHYGGAEHALFLGNAYQHFSYLEAKTPNWSHLYDLLIQIDPTNAFEKQNKLRMLIKKLRDLGLIVVGLTSSPDLLSARILNESGYDPQTDFDQFIAYTRAKGPPKILKGEAIFSQIATQLKVPLQEVIAIGDSLRYDVMPAISLGMQGCLLTGAEINDFSGITAPKTQEIMSEILYAKTGTYYE